ncbi:GTP-binding protein GEM-like, partial [Stegodyphus dumicola]|uniref:GTP-binding protein GEM-like n=1 Tax=Stegodyphus dumicola TaxID=202533 RepID=UPI0015ACB6DB
EDTEKSVFVLLDDEEYEISFIDPPTIAETPSDEQLDSDAYVVVYSITDRCSFEKAVDYLFKLREKGCTMNKAVILVGNKSDLVRSRAITAEGESASSILLCHF